MLNKKLHLFLIITCLFISQFDSIAQSKEVKSTYKLARKYYRTGDFRDAVVEFVAEKILNVNSSIPLSVSV